MTTITLHTIKNPFMINVPKKKVGISPFSVAVTRTVSQLDTRITSDGDTRVVYEAAYAITINIPKKSFLINVISEA